MLGSVALSPGPPGCGAITGPGEASASRPLPNVSFRSRLHEFVLGAAGCAVDFGTFRSGVVFTFVMLVGRMVWTAVAIPRSKGRLT